MIPELGKYAGPVLASYAVSLALLGLLIVASVLRSRHVKRELEQGEGRKDG